MIKIIEKEVAKCNDCGYFMTYSTEDIEKHRFEGTAWLEPNRDSIQCPNCKKHIMVQKGA